MVGRDWERGHTARCAANEEETWLRPWQYHLWMFFSAAPGVMNAARFATSWHGRNIMDPDEWVISAYDGVPAHRDPAIPVPYVHNLCFPPLDIVERVLSCLKATTKADFSHPEIQRRMDSRKEAKAPGIPLGEFEHNNCLKLGAET